MPRAGATANNLALEYHPVEGWFTAGSNAASCYTLYGKSAQKLLAGSPTVNGQVYEYDKTGADDGAAIASRWQSRWLEPTSGHPIRIRRLRVSGEGTFTMNVFHDYELGPAESMPVAITSSAATYDASFTYDSPSSLYGPTKSEDKQDFMSLGVVKAFSLQITETSTVSSFGTAYLGGTATPELGAWAMFGLNVSFVPLGLS
jgi:hypothetical protein